MDQTRTADRQDVHDALMRYCRGIDRGDGELALSSYHIGAIDDHGSYYGPAIEFTNKLCLPNYDAYDSMTPCITNEFVEFDGATSPPVRRTSAPT